MPNRPRLSKAELEVARTVWRLGQATMGEVYEAFPEERGLDYTTVQTYVRRLESKGYLKSRRVGRNKIYSPKVRPGTVIGEAIDEFMHQLFDGDLVPLVKHLVEDRGISDAELEQLRAILDQADNRDEQSN